MFAYNRFDNSLRCRATDNRLQQQYRHIRVDGVVERHRPRGLVVAGRPTANLRLWGRARKPNCAKAWRTVVPRGYRRTKIRPGTPMVSLTSVVGVVGHVDCSLNSADFQRIPISQPACRLPRGNRMFARFRRKRRRPFYRFAAIRKRLRERLRPARLSRTCLAIGEARMTGSGDGSIEERGRRRPGGRAGAAAARRQYRHVRPRHGQFRARRSSPRQPEGRLAAPGRIPGGRLFRRRRRRPHPRCCARLR